MRVVIDVTAPMNFSCHVELNGESELMRERFLVITLSPPTNTQLENGIKAGVVAFYFLTNIKTALKKILGRLIVEVIGHHVIYSVLV